MCSNESSPNSSCNFGSHRVRVSSNFASMFSLWKIALLYFFSLYLICFLQKYPIKIEIFKFSTARVKNHQIPNLVVQIKSQLFFKVLITLQCNERWFFCSFLAATAKKSENVHFVKILLSKAYNDLNEKDQKTYVSWPKVWRKAWCLIPKATWGISRTLMQGDVRIRICTLMC